MTTVTAQKRDMNVKAKKLRREGFIPGVVCSRDMEDMPIVIAEKEAMRLIRNSKKGEQVTLVVDNEKINAIIKEVSYNAMLKQAENIDFQALVKGEKINTTVEIKLKNEQLVEGSVTQEVSEVSYKADSDHLVDTIVLDFEQMRGVKSMKVSELDMYKDPDIFVHTSGDSVIFSVTENVGTVEETAETAEE